MLNVDASEDESRIRLPRWLITDRTFLIVWITDSARLDQNVAALYRRKRIVDF
jgi:hypothetical protein